MIFVDVFFLVFLVVLVEFWNFFTFGLVGCILNDIWVVILNYIDGVVLLVFFFVGINGCSSGFILVHFSWLILWAKKGERQMLNLNDEL